MICQSMPGLNEPAGANDVTLEPFISQISLACRRCLAKDVGHAVAVEVDGERVGVVAADDVFSTMNSRPGSPGAAPAKSGGSSALATRVAAMVLALLCGPSGL